MKKLMFIALATVTFMFTSCWTDKKNGNDHETEKTEMTDTTLAPEDETVVDTAAAEEVKAENVAEAAEAPEKEDPSNVTK